MARPEPLVAKTATAEEGSTPTALPDATARSVKLLVYGASGAGKTALAGTAEDDARTSPVLFLDLENGSRTISWRNKRIRVMTPDDFNDDLEAVLRAILDGATYKPTGEKYRTVVIDTLTAASVMVQDKMLGSPHRSRSAPEATLEYGEWNEYTHRVFQLIRSFRDAGVNVIATAQETFNDRNVAWPAVEGKKLREQIPQAFDIVGRLFVARVPSSDGNGTRRSRRILLQDDGTATAKSRGDAFELMPPALENPTIAQILDRDEDGSRKAIDQAKRLYGY